MFTYPSSKGSVIVVCVILALATLVLALGGGFVWGHGRATVTEMAKAAKLEQERLATINELNEKLTIREKKHEAEKWALLNEFGAITARKAEQDAALVARYRSGEQRLRFEVANCRAAAQPGVVTPAGGADAPATAELSPATSAAIVGLTNEADDAVNQLTALQKYTNNLYTTCTKRNEP